MAYTIPQVNTTGVDVILREVTTSVPIFTPFLLLFIFMVIFLTGYRKQKTESGNADAPLWATIAGVTTSITALILSQGTGLIDMPTLVVTFVIAIFCGIWLFSSGDRQ